MSLLATKTKQTRSEGGFVPRNGVLVDGDVAVLQDFLHFGAPYIEKVTDFFTPSKPFFMAPLVASNLSLCLGLSRKPD